MKGGIDMAQALSGISVLDLTDGISGAYCTCTLADMGATVVKVEKPEIGDSMRTYGPEINGVHPAFTAYNRSKKSITLDLEDVNEVARLKTILGKFDVLVDNFHPGTMEKLGLDYESLKAEFPRLITLSITAFGSSNSYSDRPAYEGTLQAESGISFSIADDSDGTPYMVGGSMASIIGSQYAVIALLGALHGRTLDGKGRKIETNTYFGACYLMHFNILDFLYNNIRRPGHGSGSPCGYAHTKDGMVRINSHIQVMWERTLKLIDDPVMHEERFLDPKTREEHEPLLIEHMEKWLMQYTNREIHEIFAKAGITIGIIRDIKDLASDPHLLEREMLVLIDVPGIGDVSFVGAPFRMSGMAPTYSRAPYLGEHTAEYFPAFNIGGGKE